MYKYFIRKKLYFNCEEQKYNVELSGGILVFNGWDSQC